MSQRFNRTPIARAVASAMGAFVMAAVSTSASADGKYVAGDFHNHSTCSDGSISMQKLVKKATDKIDTPWGLDWFVQAGHGGSGNRNCTLVEDATLATPVYPVVFSATGAQLGPTTTWQNSNPPVQPKGLAVGTAPAQIMWRWQSIQEFQYPLMEYLSAYKGLPLFMGVETVAPGHEHVSMSVITGQIPSALDNTVLPVTPGYPALGNATALAQWEYCFDRADTDTGRGNTVVGGAVGNNWDCSVTGSLNASDPSWNPTAQKLMPASGAGAGLRGHNKTLEGLKWMAEKHPKGSYYVPAHLERAGPFNPDGNNGYNIEHLRDFNNTAPNVAFGFETQPGHGASSERGEYFPRRNNFAGVLVDSVGGTTYGGTGVYGAQIGGVWDALLGEGRNWWFFASSDWHNRGIFGGDDRRSTQDFLPGEYQRNYTLVREDDDSRRKMRPQAIVNGLRSGNNFVASGQLIDRLAFVACATREGRRKLNDKSVMGRALEAAQENSDDFEGRNCATMGEKLTVRPGADIIVAVVVRDPAGTNYSPYSFDNPSLAQIGIKQPLNAPVLDHVDVIGGLVTGRKTPGAADYAGEWPRTWLSNPDLNTVPAGAKNTTASRLRIFNSANWFSSGEYKKMVFRIPGVSASQFVRVRGTNLPPSVPFETDADGNPLPDIHTNATTTNVSTGVIGTLKIPCNVAGSNVPSNETQYPAGSAPIDGCPNHLPAIAGQKYVAYDVAAWADLWFYSNPIYIEVEGSSTVLAGVSSQHGAKHVRGTRVAARPVGGKMVHAAEAKSIDRQVRTKSTM